MINFSLDKRVFNKYLQGKDIGDKIKCIEKQVCPQKKKNNYMHKKSLKIPRKQMHRNSDEYVKIVINSQL